MTGETLRRALKEGLVGAVAAAGMALPMLGFRLVDSSQGLSLGTRFDWVAIAAVVVGLGRFLLTLLGAAWEIRKAARPPMTAKPADSGPNIRMWAGWMLVGAAAIMPLLPFADRNLIDKATLVLIYVMLGWGLNIVVGLAGLLDLGFVAFYAVGAYSYALLSTTFGWSFWVCLPLAGVLAACFGIALGFPVLRLRGDYLAIVTLGFGEIIRVILQNWQVVTGGPNGISGIPRPTLFGLYFQASAPEGHTTFADFFKIDFAAEHRITFLYYVILVLAMMTNLFTLRVRRLPVGRAWEALREDEIACRSLGLNPTNIKLSAFALGAMFAGFAGSFFSTRQGFISPESFTFIESAVILAIVVLGGMGSQIGVVLAALLLVGLPEWFRELQQYRMLAFGGAMVLIMLWKPSGLLSSRAPTIRLKGAS
jgi:branched-chain amino acid transport system permease protein